MPLSVPAGFFKGTEVDRVIGQTSGDANTGDNVFLAGEGAGDLNTGDNVIAIGNGALDAGNPDNQVIAIGLNAGGAWIGSVTPPNGPLVIGHNALAAATDGENDGGFLVIGHDALRQFPGNNFFRLVCVVGDEAFENHTTDAAFQNVAAFGFRAGFNATTGANNCTFIGSRCAGGKTSGFSTIGNNNTAVGNIAMENIGVGVNNTALGEQASEALSTGDRNVTVGMSADELSNTDECVVVGFDTANGGIGQDGVVIGSQVATATTDDRVVAIGAFCNPPAGDENIYIGANAGAEGGPAGGSIFALETRNLGTDPMRGGLFCDMADGNVIVGMNTDVTDAPIDRDLSGTNVLKILSGSAPTANPVGGGFLYVTLGALSYRGTAGTITALALA